MTINLKRSNKNNKTTNAKNQGNFFDGFGIGKNITESGEYLAHITAVSKNSTKPYVRLTPYDFEDGSEVTYENVTIYLNANNAEGSAAAQFIKLFRNAKTDNEIKAQDILVYIELNESSDGKTYKNVLEVRKVDKDALEKYKMSQMAKEAVEPTDEEPDLEFEDEE